jgi:hypothetical protein
MAAWLNLSYPATKARVHRLRVKLAHEATAYVEAADESVRSELRRYMARAGVPLAETTVEGTVR